MKSLLLKKEDYDKIVKMDPSEVIKFLQDGVYKEEIDSLAIKFSGIKLVENAVNKHLTKIFLKLKMISDPNTNFLLNQYLKRYDFWNIKTILRAKLTNVKEESILELLLPVGSLKIDMLRKLFSKGSAREILNSCNLVNISEFREALDNFERTNDLSEIENLLDYHYYKDSMLFCEKIPEEGKLFKEFFQYEVGVYDLKIILKKIFFKLERKNVEKYLIFGGKELSKKSIYSLLAKDSLQSFMGELKKTYYGKIFANLKEDVQDPLLRYEVLFDEFLLKKSILLFHQHPLTVDVVLGFMFAKEIEVKNIRTIIKSKKLEFTEDYVKKLIIIQK